MGCAGDAASRVNLEMVRVDDTLSRDERIFLLEGLEAHVDATGSRLAKDLLRSWRQSLRLFRRVAPRQGEPAQLASWTEPCRATDREPLASRA